MSYEWNNGEPNFVTQSGKKYAVTRFTMTFKDKDLEDNYLKQLSSKTIPRLIVICKIAYVFIAAVLTVWKVVELFDDSPYSYLYYASGFVVNLFLHPLLKSIEGKEQFYIYYEYICLINHILYVDYLYSCLEFFTFWQSSGKVYFNGLGFSGCLMIIIAKLCPRRLKLLVASSIFSLVLNILMAVMIKSEPSYYIVGQRLLVELIGFVGTLWLGIKSELESRNRFLFQHDCECWRINEEDIVFEDKLGSGTFGEVYQGMLNGGKVAVKKILAKNLELNEEDLLKDILKDTKSQKSVLSRTKRSKEEHQKNMHMLFEREIRIMAQMRHPNIVAFLGACLSPRNMLLVTEYCELGSLFSVLEDPRQKPISYELKLEFAEGVALGLHYLHAQKPPMIHRDFKSLNILVTMQYQVKVCDFGMSGFQDALSTSKSKNEEPRIIGTIPWMAPEVFGGAIHTIKSDIYSYAIVLWEIYSELHPYMEEMETMNLTTEELILNITTNNYRPSISKHIPSTCPKIITDLMRKCWNGDQYVRPDWTVILDRLALSKEEVVDSPKKSKESHTLVTSLTRGGIPLLHK